MKYVGLVYSNSSKMLRRIVVLDDGEERESLRLHVGPGEHILITTNEKLLDTEGRPTREHIEALIEKETGVKPASPRCVVVDGKGEVVGVIHADAEIDTLPGKVLVNHPHADVGWKRNKADHKKFDGPEKKT